MMDAATTAAVAALVVSILAMTIATAQVLQQYLNTGQLIRMCDSVVYGRMPGQGRRVWQYTQFRFRVVYSVPQVCLRPALWKASLPQYDEYERGLHPLPDLRHKVDVQDYRPTRLLPDTLKSAAGSAHFAVAGEACWVSLCRVAQHSCMGDLFYDLQHCDADRCPSDLPVVPMQVSMRDIVVIALMAGMKCTDASFEGKSLAMDGEAGTITSSWHSMLGSIIHFSPRNVYRPLGIQIRAGSIEPAWMARMWDTVTIAGRRYDARERRIYELYEGHSLVATSRGRSMVKASPLKTPISRSPVRSFRLRSASPTRTLRRRRTAHSPSVTPFVGGNAASTPLPHTRKGNATDNFHDSNQAQGTSDRQHHARKLVGGQPNNQHGILSRNISLEGVTADEQKRTGSHTSLAVWKRHIRKLFSRKPDDSRVGVVHQKSNEHNPDIEGYGAIANSTVEGTFTQGGLSRSDSEDLYRIHQASSTRLPDSSNVNANRVSPASGQRRMLDGRDLQEYIEEKQQAEQNMLQGRNLFLTWKPLATRPSSSEAVQEDWQTSLLHLRRERSSSLVDKWRDVLNCRQQMRQERTITAEWEIESYYSASRQSSTAASERRRRLSPSDVRSFSRESRSPRRSKQGSPKDIERRRSRTADKEKKSKQVHRQSSPPRSSSLLSSISREAPIKYSYGREPIEVGENNETRHSAPPPIDPADHHGPRPDPETTALPNTGASRRKRVHYRAGDEVPTATDEGGPRKDAKGIDASEHLEVNEPVPANPEATADPPRGILRPPRERFPDEPEPLREGVAPLGKAGIWGIPAEARWTKISRQLVNPEALERAGERFEERDDYVIVLRVLTKSEIMDLAESTRDIRDARVRLAGEQAPELGSVQANASHHPEDGPAQRNAVDTTIEPIRSADPSTTDASSSINWSSQSVHGSGAESKISYSPDTMSETEETNWDRTSSIKLPGPNIASDTAQGLENPAATAHTGTNRSISPRQALAAGREERLKMNGFPPRRRASTRSRSSSLEGSSSGSDESSLVSISEVDPRERHASSKNKGSNMQQTPMVKTTLGDGLIKWLWICQIDVLPGYFANPWHDYFSRETCLGAIVAMSEALEYYTDRSTLAYVDSLPWCEQWMYRGQTTHPSYAINAMGGVIIPGEYDLVKFECFGSQMPVIQLLGSYHRQIDPSCHQGSDSRVIESLTELMAIDSWLSFCGRQPEIYDGRNNLLQSMPMLIQKLMSDYEFEFSTLDRTSADGGHQIVKELAGLITHTLEKLLLSEEEQLFTIMAMMRAAKMALCLLNGPTTARLRDIFLRDVQVYLV